MTQLEVAMAHEHRARGGGLAAIGTEVDEIMEAVAASTGRATEEFFASYAADPDPRVLAAWLAPRAWREIDYVFLLNEEVRRYGLGFERKHLALLAKQSFQEAEHYELVGRAIESLGGVVPVDVPAEAQPWHDFLWDSLDRHPLAAIAAWNVSETSASASFEPTFRAGEQHGFDEVVRVYRRIEADERFHVGLGRQLLARYARTDDDRAEILRAMRGMRDIAWRTFTPESVAAVVER